MIAPDLPMFPFAAHSGDRHFMNWISNALNTVGNSLSGLPISWVDFLTIIIVAVGIIRGRKRGLSEEFLDTVKWLVILVAAAFFYRPLAEQLNWLPLHLSMVTYCVLSYLLIAGAVALIFLFFKKRFGQKLIEGDVFGRFEFYGGMAAGAVRWLCVYLIVLAVLHAPQYTAEELEERRKRVEYNFGSDFFGAFSICQIQPAVFKNSITGRAAENYGRILLIDPTSTQGSDIRGDGSLAKRRERDVDAVMNGR